jgi:carboxylesterase type B
MNRTFAGLCTGLIVTCCYASSMAYEPGRIVTTTGGEVRGLISQGIAQGRRRIGERRSKAFACRFHDGSRRARQKSEFTTDVHLRCGAKITATWHSRRSPTWEYQFSHGYEPLGAVHLWDLQYVFGTLIKPADQPIDRQLSETIQRYWTNFAKNGNPNGKGLAAWPKTDGRLSYLDFTSDGPVVKTDLRHAACEIFNRKIVQELSVRSSAGRVSR